MQIHILYIILHTYVNYLYINKNTIYIYILNMNIHFKYIYIDIFTQPLKTKSLPKRSLADLDPWRENRTNSWTRAVQIAGSVSMFWYLVVPQQPAGSNF